MPEKSIWEKISAKCPDTYTDGYGTKREVYEPTIIKWGRGAYQTLNKFFNGQDTVTLPDGSEGNVNKGIGALGLLTGAPSELSAIKQGAKYIPSLKKMSKPLSEAERLGIPKSMRSNPKALEDPQYWGYQQWNQRYNAAVESGNMEEAQRLRDLHFKIKAKTDVTTFAHTTPNKFTKFDPNKEGVTSDLGEGGFNGRGFYFSTTRIPTNPPKDKSILGPHGEIPTMNYGKNKMYVYLKGNKEFDVGSQTRNFFNEPNTIGINWPRRDYERGIPAEIIVGNPNNIKSANAITKTDAGNIIPIVKRDNFHNLDIRYKQGGILKTQNQ